MHLYNRIATNALAIACSPYKNLKIVIDLILNLKIEMNFKNVHAARHCVSTCQYGPQLNTKLNQVSIITYQKVVERIFEVSVRVILLF